jgi:hypothetical protein
VGSRAKVRAAQRTSLKQHKAAVRDLNAQVSASPEFQALAAKVSGDPEVQAIASRDRAEQERMLRLRHWQLREAGSDGLGMWDRRGVRLIHSLFREADGEVWAHLSVSRRDNTLPSWFEVKDVQWLLYPGRAGLVVVAPQDEHVSIAEVAHVWTKLTGPPPTPDFRKLGSI